MHKLITIQKELKAPKGQFNSFGKYKYRSCEDIFETVKPILQKHDCLLTISDKLVNMGDRYYIEASVTISDGDKSVTVTALAREAENKKGSDASQITGAASSYARKYALSGLFLIDDTEDADTMDNRTTPPQGKADRKEELNNALTFFEEHGMENRADIVKDILDGKQVRHTVDQVLEAYEIERRKVK